MKDRVALTFSGGGAYGAFQVGVAGALASGHSPVTGYRPLDPEIYSGTSVGAYNATFLASHWQHPLERSTALLRDAWLDVISQKDNAWGCGVVRYRANPFKFLDPRVFARDPLQWGINLFRDGIHITSSLARQMEILARETRRDPSNAILSLFDVSTFTTTEPFDDTLRRTIDYDSLRRTPKQLAVVATDWTTGEPRIFNQEEIGCSRGASFLRGSASIPGLFPPMMFDHSLLVDGGVVMNVPIEPAIRAGANVLYIVAVTPRKSTSSERVLRSTVGSMLSAQLAAWRFALKVKLETVESINYALDRAEKTGAALQRDGGQANSRLLDELEEMKRLLEQDLAPDQSDLRQITAHIFQPEKQLGGGPLGMIDFHQDYLQEHIEEGYRQAVEHDCEENGCILPFAQVEGPKAEGVAP